VNYRGFRIIAVSVIPISKQTIIYGSHDGGKTVHADYEAFNVRLNRIFAGFNLKVRTLRAPHSVTSAFRKLTHRHLLPQAHLVKDCVLQACGDIEGHWGTVTFHPSSISPLYCSGLVDALTYRVTHT